MWNSDHPRHICCAAPKWPQSGIHIINFEYQNKTGYIIRNFLVHNCVVAVVVVVVVVVEYKSKCIHKKAVLDHIQSYLYKRVNNKNVKTRFKMHQ